MTCTYSLTLCGILTVLGTCEMEEGVRVDTKEEEGIQGNHLIYTEQSPWHKNQQSPRPKNLHANSLIKGLYVHLPCILACTHMQLTACIQVLLGSNTNDEKPPTSFYTHAHTHTHTSGSWIYTKELTYYSANDVNRPTMSVSEGVGFMLRSYLQSFLQWNLLA